MASYVAPSENDASVWDLLSGEPALNLLYSALGGCVVPFLDGLINPRVKQYLTLCLCFYETTGILRVLRLSGLVVTSSTSLFKFMGVWLLLQPVPPMMRYIVNLGTDEDLLEDLTNVDYCLYLYFGPIVVARIMICLWSIRGKVALVSASMVGIWALCPQSLKYPVALRVVLVLRAGWAYKCQNDISIRGLWFRSYEALVRPLDRWEIAMAQQSRERRGHSLKPYAYRALESPRHVRLLRLERRTRTFCSEPTGELVQVSLAKAPEFEALSYTWGDKDPSIPIIIEGRHLLVTSAVDQFLFHRRTIFGPRFLWIDAVCINQADKDEKNQQLPFMTEIYRRASRVIVWLGPPQNIQETRTVRRLIRALSLAGVFRVTGLSDRVKMSDLLPTLFNEEEAAFIALSRLFKNPWFQRIWVVQEVSAAEVVHIMYNGICIDWNTLASAVREIGSDVALSSRMNYEHFPRSDSIETSGLGLPTGPLELLHWQNAAIMAKMRDKIRSGSPVPLMLLMAATLIFKSKDPRDKIFALLGIASDGTDLPFRPDYKESVELVFIKTTSYLLSSEDWFTQLVMSGSGLDTAGSTGRPVLRELPSWVPDYTANAFEGIRLGHITHEQISQREKAGKITFTDNPRVIQIAAVAFDSIRRLGPRTKLRTYAILSPNSNVSTATFTEHMRVFLTNAGAECRDWFLQARELARSFSASARKSQEAADQEFWELCMSGETSDDTSDPSALLYPLNSHSARKVFEFFILTESGEMLEHVGEWLLSEKLSVEEAIKMQRFLTDRFAMTISGKTFCITSTGSIALAPPLAREDDMLVHVRGGYVPVVLRRKGHGGRVAELVGGCYVHGVDDLYFGSDWEDWLIV